MSGSTKIFVGNVGYNTASITLSEAIGHLGLHPISVRIAEDRDTGRGCGFAFVEFKTSAEAEEALGLVNGAMVDGRFLRANLVYEQERRSPKASQGKPRHDDRGQGQGRTDHRSKADGERWEDRGQRRRRDEW